MLRRQQKKNKGYTLIETVVGIFIFSMVILVAAGTLMSVMRQQRQALKDQELIDSIRGAQEILTRAIRIGYGYTVVETDNNPVNTSITISHPAKIGVSDCPATPPCLVTYYWAQNAGIGVLYEQNELATTGTPITSERINVSRAEFYVTGISSADTMQSRVMIYLEASPIGSATSKTIRLQTSVAQRVLDIP